MKDLKELFDQAENGVFNYEQFMNACKNNDVKLVDLNEGGYVSKNKYEAELDAKAKEIATLNGTISTRDTDLDALQKKLAEAGADSSKLGELNTQFAELKGKYEADTKAYKEQLKKQAYEFAVKEFAGTKQFSSQAAKRDFIQSMIAKQLKMEGDTILGADDFVNVYTENNADAFVTEIDLGNDGNDNDNSQLPQFVSSTPGAADAHTPDPTGGFLGAMHFMPIHPMPQE